MDPIDLYLDELAGLLRLGPDRQRRFLEEAETHLRDAEESEVRAGATPGVAAARAIARFGTAREVARAAHGGWWGIVAGLAAAGAQLVGVGFAAILAGTLVAEVLARVTSTGWVFGLPDGFTPHPGQVGHWLAVQSGAPDWQSAAAAENAHDALVLRGLFALVALGVAVAVLLLTRQVVRPDGGTVSAVGATAFGVVGLGLVLVAATGGSYPLGDWGRGQALSDAAVALVAALVFGVSATRRLRVD